MRLMLLAVVLALLGTAAHAQTQTLVDMATISMSAPGVPRTVTDAVCATDGNDLVCDRSVYITSSSRVGIGTNNPGGKLSLSSVSGTNNEITLHNGVGSAYLGQLAGQNWLYMINNSPGSLLLGTSNTVRLLVEPGGRVGIGTGSNSVWAQLEVSGTLRIANSGEPCDANRTGAIRYTGGDFSFCRNGSTWETLATVASASDRIVSGTSSVIVNGAASTISFSTAGATMGWLNGAGVLSVRGRLDLVTGTGVVAVGSGAGQSNTGSYTTAVGFGAAQGNAGADIVAVGHYAALDNSSSNIVAIGQEAARLNSGTNVVAVGLAAARFNSGIGTTAIGGNAAESNSGVVLTAIGNQAGRSNIGHYVTALGYAAVTSNTFNNVTGIGFNAQPTKANQIMLGDISLTEVFSYGAGVFNKYVRPGSATTALLPAASSAGAGAIMYDSTIGGLVYSNGSAWTAVAGGGGASFDRITSGTSAVVVNSATGIVSISQLGAVASYVHPNLGYVGPGVSATGTVSASKVATNEMLLSKTGGACSTLADEGRMFRSPISGRLQVCSVRY